MRGGLTGFGLLKSGLGDDNTSIRRGDSVQELWWCLLPWRRCLFGLEAAELFFATFELSPTTLHVLGRCGSLTGESCERG